MVSSQVSLIHKTRLSQIEAEAAALAGTCQKIAQQAAEVLEKGGALQVQPQIAFITGSVARMVKDWGVIEQLQSVGVVQPRRMK